MPSVIYKIRPKIDNITFKISQFYFSVPQIGQNLFELFQIGAKKPLNLGSVSDRVEIGFRSALEDLCVRSVINVIVEGRVYNNFCS